MRLCLPSLMMAAMLVGNFNGKQTAALVTPHVSRTSTRSSQQFPSNGKSSHHWTSPQNHQRRRPHASSSALGVGADPISCSISTAIAPQALSLASSIGSPLAAASVLAFVILIHEMGHFVAARSLGILVKEFSIGVGPRIIGFSKPSKSSKTTTTTTPETQPKRNMPTLWKSYNAATSSKTGNNNVQVQDFRDEDEEIAYSLRLIPLGGYVQFPDNYNRTLVAEREEMEFQARAEAEEVETKNEKKMNSRKKTDLAAAYQVQQSSPRWKNWYKSGNNNKNDVTSNKEENQLSTDVPIDYYQNPNLLQNRPWTQRAIVLVGGIVFNLILAFACYFGQVTLGDGLPRPLFEAGAVVSEIPKADGPSYGKLQRGDVILGVNGKRLQLANTHSMAASQEAVSEFIQEIRATPHGESMNLDIARLDSSSSSTKPSVSPTSTLDSTISSSGGETAQSSTYTSAPSDALKKNGAKVVFDTVKITPRPLNNNENPEAPQTIGVMLAPNFVQTDKLKATSITQAATLSAQTVAEITSDTASALTGALSGMLANALHLSGSNANAAGAMTRMSGPIGVIKIGADVVSTSDLSAIAAFIAAISINLAVVNALPIPALDGGQLLLLVASEGVLGKKLDQRFQEGINGVAVLILLLASVSAAIGDVGSLVGR